MLSHSFPRLKFLVPAIMLVAVALGINSVIFSVFDSVLMRPWPYPSPQNLMEIRSANKNSGQFDGLNSMADYIDWKNQANCLENASALVVGGSIVQTPEGFERIPAAGVTFEFFDVLGVQPMAGRAFRDSDGVTPTGLGLLGFDIWNRAFGANMKIIGSVIKVNSNPLRIIGIAPSSLDYIADVDLWTLLPEQRNEPRDQRVYRVIARANQNSKSSEMGACLNTVAERLERTYPQANSRWSVRATHLQRYATAKLRPTLWFLGASALLLLAVAFLHVLSLLVVREFGNAKSTAVRAALGAPTVIQFRERLFDALLIAGCGTVLGLCIAYVVLSVTKHVIYSVRPEVIDISMSWWVVGAFAVTSAIASIVVSVVLTFSTRERDLHRALQEQVPSTGSTSRTWQKLLMMVEISLSFVLMNLAVLLAINLHKIENTDLGFEPDNVVTMRVVLPNRSPKTRIDFFQTVIDQCQRLRGIESASAVLGLPLEGGGYRLEKQVKIKPSSTEYEQLYTLNYQVIAPRYFQTMKVALSKGRDFTIDDRPSSLPVVIVNNSIARTLWGSIEVVGKLVQVVGEREARTVVGVVSDIRTAFDPRQKPYTMYVPHSQDPFPALTFVFRTTAEPQSMIEILRERIGSIDREGAVYEVQTFSDIVFHASAEKYLQSGLVMLFALTTLFLSQIGIFALTTNLIRQRLREITIRLALGAPANWLIGRLLLHNVMVAAMGILFGMGLMQGSERLLISLVDSTLLFSFNIQIVVAILTLMVVAVASYIPARMITELSRGGITYS